MASLKLTGAVISIALLIVTCKHEIPFPTGTGGHVSPPPSNSSTCSADSVYFANAVLPVISSGCAMSGCHDAASHKEGLELNNFNGIMRLVKPGNASGSKLYQVITTTDKGDIMPPPPHAPFSASTIATIQKWINQGAKNNQCTGACDTSLFTFSGAVAPVINTFCKGCHNSASLGGGIDLSSYAAVKTVAANGKLMGSITQSAGFKPMPQGGNKLQDCQVTQIDKWIKSGMPNN